MPDMGNWGTEMRWILAMALALVAMASPAAAQQQAPRPLETDVEEASKTCWIASITRAAGDNRIDGYEMADAFWFPIEASRVVTAKGPILEQIQTRANQTPADTDAVRKNAAFYAAECAKRWPKSVRGAAPITLPSELYDRELLCGAVASLLFGAAQEEEKSYGSSSTGPGLKRITDRVVAYQTDDELRRHGITDQTDLIAQYSLAIGRAVRMGNLNDVIRACR